MQTQVYDYESSESDPVFASPNKDACEKKHSELLIRNRFYNKICEHFHSCLKNGAKQLTPPVSPEYSTLPVKPLVWVNNKWQNQYHIDYDNLVKEYHSQHELIAQSIAEELAEIYKVDVAVVRGGWNNFDPTYSIVEVESDI